jgi:hypothetical protein
MIEKLECNCIEAYKIRKMRDPNCCACSCDHNDLVEQLAKANERVKELEKQSLYSRAVTFNRSDAKAELNKFALEQQELVIDAAIELELIENSAHTCNLLREQLRKERDNA